MVQDFYVISQDLSVQKLLEEVNVRGVMLAVIKDGDQILGVIDRQTLYNFIQLQMAK